MTNKTNSVVHILVIWHSAMGKYKEIIEDLNKDFQLLKVFRGLWDHDLWLDNWTVFYAHSQKDKPYYTYQEILIGKMLQCKKGDFEVIVFKDNNPCFEKRQTTSGIRLVNTRVFDKKKLYRSWFGGGSQIHASDDAWETNKDLTIMFGMNTEDFCNYYKNDFENLKEKENNWFEDSFHKNCIGVNGYKDIHQFFYVLNNTIQYVVLRNHEPIPDEYTVEGHGDIDLLVENVRYIQYLTLAKPQYPEKNRVYHHIKIGNSIIPFDFRHIGDQYYDEPWEKNILNTRTLTKGLFYTPNPINQFYTLLYHAIVQKPIIMPDYYPKLENYGKAIGVVFNSDKKKAFATLDDFMCENGYEYIHPKDESVFFNLDNLQYSSFALRNGICIKRSVLSQKIHFDTLVFKKDNSYLKYGDDWLIDNEHLYLEQLAKEKSNLFPMVLSYERCKNNMSYLETGTILGYSADKFFSVRKNCNKRNILRFVSEMLKLLTLLHRNKILHRDITMDNILIREDKSGIHLSLIDFGWATNYSKLNNPIPIETCSKYSSFQNKTDSFEFGNLLLREWNLMPVCRRIGKILIKDNPIENYDENFYDKLVKEIAHTSFFDSMAAVVYSLIKWERFRKSMIRRFILKARNERGLAYKLSNVLVLIKLKMKTLLLKIKYKKNTGKKDSSHS